MSQPRNTKHEEFEAEVKRIMNVAQGHISREHAEKIASTNLWEIYKARMEAERDQNCETTKITRQMIEDCWGSKYALDYLAEILNGEYAPDKAREDIISLMEKSDVA